jgi:hypothetical protein
MAEDAAFYGNATLLQLLLTSGCPWDVFDIAADAIRSGDSSMHEWLVSSIIRPASDAMLARLMNETGCAGNVSVLKLLRENGAVWPRSFQLYFIKLDGDHERTCWHRDAVEWAISEGSGWQSWSCEALASSKFAYNIKPKAEALFEWAHGNGCPCTCKKTVAAAAAGGT